MRPLKLPLFSRFHRPPLGATAGALAAALLLSACNKSDRPPTTAERLSSVQTKQETEKDFYVPRKTVDYMSDLKSIKDAPAKSAAEPVRAESRAAEAKPAPAPVVTAPAPVVPTPAPAPVAAAPSPAAPPPNVVASAAPTARPTPPPAPSTLVNVLSREAPDFPREATRAGIDSGTVRARININAAGEVTGVSILQATPPRVFDRAVQAALSRWKFNPGADGRSYDTEIGFKQDR